MNVFDKIDYPVRDPNLITDIVGGFHDVTAPLVLSATISEDGTETTIVFNESVLMVGYDSGDFALDCSVTDTNLSDPSGSGTTWVFSNVDTIGAGETCTLDYTGSAGEITDLAGNSLAGFTDAEATNLNENVSVKKDECLSNEGDSAIFTTTSYIGFNIWVTESYTLTKVYVRISKDNSPTGNIRAYIYATDGGNPPKPTGAPLGTSTNTVDCSTWLASPGQLEGPWLFDGLVVGDEDPYSFYQIVLFKDNGYDAFNRPLLRTGGNAAYAISGSADGSSWSTLIDDYIASWELWGY